MSLHFSFMHPLPVPIPLRIASSLSTVSHPDDDDEVRLTKALINKGSVALKELLELQNKGWHDESMDLHFQNQRQTADSAPSDLNRIWFERMKVLLGEIDGNLACVPAHAPLEFLDLGCCPGGFSSYMLDKNTEAAGFGISLSVADGGHEFCLEDYHRARFELSSTDLTYYQLGPSIIDDWRLTALPFQITGRSYDMALLDGHQLRTQLSALPWDRDRLLISQLILSLQAVKEGGTIIIKLPMPHKLISARILYMLRIISERLLGWKPRSMHGNRGTFYAVAKGVGRGLEGSRIPDILLALKELWVSLTFGGEECSGRYMVPEDLDFLITVDRLINDQLHWLLRFGRPLWQGQATALRGFYRRRGIS